MRYVSFNIDMYGFCVFIGVCCRRVGVHSIVFCVGVHSSVCSVYCCMSVSVNWMCELCELMKIIIILVFTDVFWIRKIVKTH